MADIASTSGQKGAPSRYNNVSKVLRLPTEEIEEKRREGDARRTIALRLVWAYMALLFLTVVIPLVLYWIDPAPANVSVIKDLSGPLTTGISSLTGVIGFVLGYYFKSEDRKAH